MKQLETVSAGFEKVMPIGGVGAQGAKLFDQGFGLCVVGDGDPGDGLIGKTVYDPKWTSREARIFVPDRAESGCAEFGADAASRLAKAQIRNLIVFEEEQVVVDDLPVVVDERPVLGDPFE